MCEMTVKRTRLCFTNKDLCRIPGHATQAKAGLQEPGLRPIGRSPGVPDKSSRGLGSMSQYSAQILICFIAYIFLFSIPLWVWLGTLQD